VMAPGADLDRWSTSKGAVFEGIVLKVKPGDAETPNCGAKDQAHQDTHIELALDPTAAANRRVIVEVTPKWRAKMAVIFDWSTATLKKQLLGKRVRITGWLLADFIHRGQAENTHPGGAKNWRATVWEIHPITAIQVLPGPALSVPNASATTTGKSPHRGLASKRRCTKSNGRSCRKGAPKTGPRG
jgi:hypothetical protein